MKNPTVAIPQVVLFWVFSNLAVAACTQQAISFGETKNGALSATDCVNRYANGSDHYYDEYAFAATSGQQIAIANNSASIDPDILLIYPDGSTLYNDDALSGGDSGGDGGGSSGGSSGNLSNHLKLVVSAPTDARLPPIGFLTLTQTGTYRIRASSFPPAQTGPYSLTLLLGSATVNVVEFHNAPLNQYFITGNAAEATAIDEGAAGPGWSRTGNTFIAGGPSGVCRFYGSISPGPNSHFYTIDPIECAALKQLQATTPANQPRWNFESMDFLSTAAVGGTCAAGLIPIYRAYNNGFARGVDSNHRITNNATAYQQTTTAGWRPEGIVMCALPGGTAADCAYALGHIGDQWTGGGGMISVPVAAGSGCAWSASSNVSWVTIAGDGNGGGSGSFSYVVAPNPTSQSRTGTLSIAGLAFTVSQAGMVDSSCTFSLTSTNLNMAVGGGTGSVGVSAPPGCAWLTTSNVNWIGITGGSSGSGNGTVTFSVFGNATSTQRTGTVTVAGQLFTVTQAPAVNCTYKLSVHSADFGPAGGIGSVEITAPPDCPWSATSHFNAVTITGNSSGTGNGTIVFVARPNDSSNTIVGTLTIAGILFKITIGAPYTPPDNGV